MISSKKKLPKKIRDDFARRKLTLNESSNSEEEWLDVCVFIFGFGSLDVSVTLYKGYLSRALSTKQSWSPLHTRIMLNSLCNDSQVSLI